MQNLSNGPKEQMRLRRGLSDHAKDLGDLAASTHMASAAKEARAAAGIATNAWRTALTWVAVVAVLAAVVAAWVLTNK